MGKLGYGGHNKKAKAVMDEANAKLVKSKRNPHRRESQDSVDLSEIANVDYEDVSSSGVVLVIMIVIAVLGGVLHLAHLRDPSSRGVIGAPVAKANAAHNPPPAEGK